MGSTRGEPALLCLDFCNALLALSMLNQSPGRFFAANELKCMMAYVLLNYDFKFEDGTVGKPKNVEIFGNFSPNRTANLLFRKHQS